MSLQKLGGSLRYRDLGPGEPGSVFSASIGGRSVHAPDASSGLTIGSLKAIRPAVKGQRVPLTIKARPPGRTGTGTGLRAGT